MKMSQLDDLVVSAVVFIPKVLQVDGISYFLHNLFVVISQSSVTTFVNLSDIHIYYHSSI